MTLVRSLSPTRPRIRRTVSPLRRLFTLSPDEASFARRGFTAADAASREVLEAVGRSFVAGYNTALLARDVGDVEEALAGAPQAMRGFFAEGAAMGVAIADGLSLRRSQLAGYLAVADRDFTYLAHVGAGWALARMPWRRRAILASLDPLHGWLAFDGLGFHDAYFHARRIAAGWRRETQGYAARVYDQGIGRALWFAGGGDVNGAAALIAALDAARHDDLWSGLGLAMAYAGPADAAALGAALDNAGTSQAAYAQGVAFAAEARARARFMPLNTDRAARMVWHCSGDELAERVRRARARLPRVAAGTEPPRYELWRADVAREWRPPA